MVSTHRLCSRDRQSVGEAGTGNPKFNDAARNMLRKAFERRGKPEKRLQKVVEVVQMPAKEISRIKNEAVSCKNELLAYSRRRAGNKKVFRGSRGYRGHYMENGTIHYMPYNGPNGWRRLANSSFYEEQEALRKEKERTKAEREAERESKEKSQGRAQS